MPYGARTYRRVGTRKPRAAYTRKPKFAPKTQAYRRFGVKKTTALTRVVKSMINRSQETKMKVVNIARDTDIPGAGLSDDGSVGHNAGLVFTNLFDTVALQQGVQQEQRVGNKVANAYLSISGVMHSVPFNSTTNDSPLPFEVHMLAYRRRKSIMNSYDQIKSLPHNTVGPVDNTLINSTYPWNKDSYEIIKHRVFRLRPREADHTANIMNGQVSNAPMFRRFKQNLKISKKLLFQDGNTLPSNTWVGVAFYVINPDGSVLHQPSISHPAHYQVRAKVSFDAVLRFKDA